MPSTRSDGASFIVVANRLPVDLERSPDGTQRWRHSPGGLVTALEPFLRSQHGAWVGWPGVADTDVEGFSDEGMLLEPVSLSAGEVRDYYEGFSNGTLWPLYHDVVAPPVFDRSWWDSYVKVNRRFADACANIAAIGATVWVQDYQLQLVPAMLREQRPDLRIGFFLHIPFPPVELFMQLPWRTEIIRGLLGADLVGFHLPGGAQNFLWLARRLVGLEPTRGAVGVRTRPGSVQFGDRTVRVGAFPISIDSTGLDALSRRKDVVARSRQIRADLGNPRKILLGVDRLDYTKGIDVRLRALGELLGGFPARQRRPDRRHDGAADQHQRRQARRRLRQGRQLLKRPLLRGVRVPAQGLERPERRRGALHQAPAIAFSIADNAALALAPSGPPACAMSGRPPPPLPPSASDATRTRSTAL